jgi:hypothetical protein
MRCSANASSPLRRVVGVRLQPGYQFLQVLCWQNFLGDNQQRLASELGNRGQILQQVVRERVEAADRQLWNILGDCPGISPA